MTSFNNDVYACNTSLSPPFFTGYGLRLMIYVVVGLALALFMLPDIIVATSPICNAILLFSLTRFLDKQRGASRSSRSSKQKNSSCTTNRSKWRFNYES